MKLQLLFSFTFLLFALTSIHAQNLYSCFQNDKNQNLKISACFDKNDRAIYVKYKGNEETIPLFYSKKEVTPNTGGHPSAYVFITYIESIVKK